MTTTTHLMELAKRPASFLLLVTFLLSICACAQERVPIHIDFAAEWGGKPLTCSSAEPALTDLRFYVSDVGLIDSQGSEQKLVMTVDGAWQQNGVALIDLETANAACQNGSSGMNASIIGTANAADFVGLRFTVGVPFELNHANPLLADPPLDDSAMHWHWRSGYKFLRAGVATEADGFWIHVGSTGCEGTVQQITGCQSPNRISVVLPRFDPDQDRVVVDLSALFSDVDLDDDVRGDCSSGPAESSCRKSFAALGLAFDGDKNQHEQRVFRAQQ